MGAINVRQRAGAGTLVAAVAALILAGTRPADASTYAAYIPLDSSIYEELEELNDLGLAESYLSEIKPISRVEAARLTVEAESRLSETQTPSPLGRSIITALREQLPDEVEWIEQNKEDGLPTMIHPVERVEAQYVFSTGTRRQLDTGPSGINFREGTPLLPYNDDLATSHGNNEVLRWSGWTGIGGFLTGYGEGAIAGPLTDNPHQANRAQLLTGAAVVGLGNTAISFGQEETSWGVGHFGQLAQTSNALPFPALRVQNIHPSHLPSVLRYLGLFRYQTFLGQLDAKRTYARPWISGQVVTFKTLPFLEWGLTHVVMFGGAGNDSYSGLGFLGRATGVATGNPNTGNTNSRVSLFTKVYFPSLRHAQLYGEILGEDFFEPFGKSVGIKTPFKGPSYIAGIYVPEVTRDGRTTARIEYTLTDKEYSVHSDSLYWSYQNRLMGNALGPAAWQVNVALGRWLNYQSKLDVDAFYTSRKATIPVPTFPAGLRNESSYGVAFNFLHLPVEIGALSNSLGEMRASTAFEYVNNVNYTGNTSMRAMVQLSFGFTPSWGGLVWR